MTDLNVIVTDESVTIGLVSVEHNTIPWRTATNRHPNTDGSSWGWIVGAPGHACWSNNELFNAKSASALVVAHNKWLDDQQPLSLKIINAKKALKSASEQFTHINTKHAEALLKLNEAQMHLDSLLSKRNGGQP